MVSTNEQEQVLTTGEAAALCGVSRSTLRRAVAQGHIKAWHTPGKHLRFSRAACNDFARFLGRADLVGTAYQQQQTGSMPVGAGTGMGQTSTY